MYFAFARVGEGENGGARVRARYTRCCDQQYAIIHTEMNSG